MTSIALRRHPVQVALDGDFDLHGVLAALPTVGARQHPRLRPGIVAPLLQTQIWRLPALVPVCADSPEDTCQQDLQLLHAIETSGLWQPPIAHTVTNLDPATARLWLVLAEHWLAIHNDIGDLRFLNGACRLFGGVWARWVAELPDALAWNNTQLRTQAALVANAILAATSSLAHQAQASYEQPPTKRREDTRIPLTVTTSGPGRVVLLCADGSVGARRLLHMATKEQLSIAHVLWYHPENSSAQVPSGSSYASAWYPPSGPDPCPLPDTSPAAVYETSHVTGWESVRSRLQTLEPDAVLLVGMPIVPTRVLDTAPLGFLNAHNGTMPQYRGMDAVGWALLNGDPITCSLHIARREVDSGEVMASISLPCAPLETLRHRVKHSQLQLLMDAARYIVAGRALPPAQPQASQDARLYYRMHPHLKRILDDSPYGATTEGPS